VIDTVEDPTRKSACGAPDEVNKAAIWRRSGHVRLGRAKLGKGEISV
jgi:hypothetical protein